MRRVACWCGSMIVAVAMLVPQSAQSSAAEVSAISAMPVAAASDDTRPIVMRVRPRIEGKVHYGKRLVRKVGRYSVGKLTYRTQWLRDGKPIRGARRWAYRVRPGDIGHRIGVKVTVSRPGFRPTTRWAHSRRAVHATRVKRTVSYSIATRGSIKANLKVFRRQVAQTFDDPRGWRAAGVRFRAVKSGGDFTVVLAQAQRVPDFSSFCSSSWSCRVGRNVIINQDRWLKASSAWNAASGTTRRGYRHMVVNHETGHWLGLGHASCSSGAAPVMMQQSKSTGACSFNAWPLASEIRAVR